MLLEGHNHQASSHSASDLVTRAGGALVVQAGTAISTRVRSQEQSFNVIDVAEASVTIAVNAWKGERFEPLAEQQFAWSDGRWRFVAASEPAH
jgi:hypothetical protein